MSTNDIDLVSFILNKNKVKCKFKLITLNPKEWKNLSTEQYKLDAYSRNLIKKIEDMISCNSINLDNDLVKKIEVIKQRENEILFEYGKYLSKNEYQNRWSCTLNFKNIEDESIIRIKELKLKTLHKYLKKRVRRCSPVVTPI